MSTFKHNCTKGPVYFRSGISPHFQGTVMREDGRGETIALTYDDKEAANAELIAEAFSVLAETGMTPRELAKAVRHLKDTMHSVADSLTKQAFGYGRTKSKRGMEIQEVMLVEVRLLNTVLSKYNPAP